MWLAALAETARVFPDATVSGAVVEEGGWRLQGWGRRGLIVLKVTRVALVWRAIICQEGCVLRLGSGACEAFLVL
jgi:hypothetical protein